ncbi:MAG: DUF4105 domain-containing protein [Proteobacteria bacterium]|nr:DUF4105 domain-containing protein [Pseudomonadota bacterium]
MRDVLSLAYVFLFLFCSFDYSLSQDAFDYKNYLKFKAKELGLHKDRYWHILLHYKKTFNGYESYIDDEKFFLAKDGKVNPEGELLATIDSFFQSPSEKQNEYPKCRYIARYEWLKEKLNINNELLPDVQCLEFEEIFQRLNPRSASLIFPASYPNSPASMFGHTLLRLEGEFHSPLLAYAVNYSAIPEDDFALIYTFKGIFGYYKGIFTALPYYDKVREYSDIERRDIWEYNLNLTPEEVRRMFLHLWELKDIYQYYYFFDENCSYNILFLIESARPTVRLVDKFRYWVIPVDTIRTVISEGLVEKINYRPSIHTRIKNLSKAVSEERYEKILKLVGGQINPQEVVNSANFSLLEKQKILEISAEILQYRYFKKEITKEDYQKRYFQVLSARSKFPMSEESKILEMPSSPETGHESSRLKIGTGIYNGNGYLDISFRPAYHDITNNDRGYIEGSQIIFTDFNFKYLKNKFFLERADLINIISLTPMDYFSKPLSWRVKTGFERKGFSFAKDDIYYFLQAGGGVALKRFTTLSYLLINGSLEFGGVFEKNFSSGLGLEVGLIKSVSNRDKMIISAETIQYLLGDKHKLYKINLIQNFFLRKDLEIGIKYTRQKVFSSYSYDLGTFINFFFP